MNKNAPLPLRPTPGSCTRRIRGSVLLSASLCSRKARSEPSFAAINRIKASNQAHTAEHDASANKGSQLTTTTRTTTGGDEQVRRKHTVPSTARYSSSALAMYSYLLRDSFCFVVIPLVYKQRLRLVHVSEDSLGTRQRARQPGSQRSLQVCVVRMDTKESGEPSRLCADYYCRIETGAFRLAGSLCNFVRCAGFVSFACCEWSPTTEYLLYLFVCNIVYYGVLNRPCVVVSCKSLVCFQNRNLRKKIVGELKGIGVEGLSVLAVVEQDWRGGLTTQRWFYWYMFRPRGREGGEKASQNAILKTRNTNFYVSTARLLRM